MDSVVEAFHMEEVDGKQYLIYHLNNPDESTLFLCPGVRISQSKKRYMDRNDQKWDPSTPIEIDCSPYFNGVIEEKDNHYILPLFWCNNKNDGDNNISLCSGCLATSGNSLDFYFCVKCRSMYHKGCVMAPLEIQSPCDPTHTLKLSFIYSDAICVQCGKMGRLLYHCTKCNLSMHTSCAFKPIPFVIEKPKRHDHPLTFFTRKACLDCNVCGLIKQMNSTYICLKCNFVAHQDCVDFPTVIRISRHHHRISFTSFLPRERWICGVCRKYVDSEYGAYTCKKCDSYVVHSRCALREDIWDGEELEGVPEEDDIEEVVDPFERISDGIILHFLHEHYLKLKMSGEIYDENKICDGCVLPIYEGEFHSCMECDFILHDKCAKSSRRIHHPLHPHPLILKVTSKYDDTCYFLCDGCERPSSGFVYECTKREGCFKLDLHCALVFEPFDYQGHEHPLFLALDPRERKACQVCEMGLRNLINCIKCDFIRCFECITLPCMVKYKHDKHFLELSYWEDTDEPDWCEICEKQIFTRKYDDRRFYTCKQCCVTLHHECLFGQLPYMKPGHTLLIEDKEFQILSNNSLSRPTCHGCHVRIVDKIIFKNLGLIYCAIHVF